MLVARSHAAAVRLQTGSVLVSGGWSGSSKLLSSELLTGSNWTAAMQLPSARMGHCMLQLSSGQLFLQGGLTGSGNARDTYISADLTSWTQMASSKAVRKYHACTEVTINKQQQVWLGGSYNDGTSEIYMLSSSSSIFDFF